MAQNENTVIRGAMFIIPNGLHNANSLVGKERRLRILGKLGITIPSTMETPLVKIWTTDENLSENWSDHGVGLHKIPGCTDDISQEWECLSWNWPAFFPAALFEGKKEGETIILHGEGLTFEFKLEQLPHRYGDKGNFQTILRKLLHKYYSPEECEWRDKHWSE